MADINFIKISLLLNFQFQNPNIKIVPTSGQYVLASKCCLRTKFAHSFGFCGYNSTLGNRWVAVLFAYRWCYLYSKYKERQQHSVLQGNTIFYDKLSTLCWNRVVYLTSQVKKSHKKYHTGMADQKIAVGR